MISHSLHPIKLWKEENKIITVMAVKGDDLFNKKPKADITKLPLQMFLPSVSDCQDLHTEITVLVARVLVKH